MTGPKERARTRRLHTSTTTPAHDCPSCAWRLGLCAASLALVAAACGGGSTSDAGRRRAGARRSHGELHRPGGIHKIKHVVIIQQENRSFDSYFGTYPGADGIPMKNGSPTVCVNDPQTGQCVAPYLDHADVNGGGPHSAPNATADINGGKMDGFIAQAQAGRRGCLVPTDPACTQLGSARRDGLPQPRATSPTTGPTPRTSCSRTTCSSRTPPGACRPTSSSCRNGRPTAHRPATPRAV